MISPTLLRRTRLSFAIACLLVPLLLASTSLAQGHSDSQRRAIDNAVQQEMQSQRLVGVAIGVIRDGKVAYVNAYGKADAEANVPATASTVFNWASNSKPIVAVLAMQLVQAGKLDLDADIRTYLPEYPDPGHVITARHLLCHQSGIPHYSNGKIVPLPDSPDSAKDESDPVASIRRFAGSPLIFAPGDRYEYSSYAYVLLSAVVQRAAEKPLGDLLTTNIVKPVGLVSFQLDTPEPRENWAQGYVRNSFGRTVPTRDTAHFWKHGAGGYKSNVEDFARWGAALLGTRVLSTEMKKLMWVDQRSTSGEVTGCGLGMFVARENGKLKVSHNGSQDETRTRLVLYPEDNHGVVVMCNCQFADPGKISTAIYRALREGR